MSSSNEGIVIQTATAELDLPPSVAAPVKSIVSSDTVIELERARFEHKKAIDRWGFILLCLSIILYFFVYAIEKSTRSVEMSSFTATFSETLKFLISALIGYLFASRVQ